MVAALREVGRRAERSLPRPGVELKPILAIPRSGREGDGGVEHEIGEGHEIRPADGCEGRVSHGEDRGLVSGWSLSAKGPAGEEGRDGSHEERRVASEHESGP